eukprot:8973390-Heterocapsa_arctica.AAC.3
MVIQRHVEMIVEGQVPMTQEESIHVPLIGCAYQFDNASHLTACPGLARKGGNIFDHKQMSLLAACPGIARKGYEILAKRAKLEACEARGAGQVRLRAVWNAVRVVLDGQRTSRLLAARNAADERARAAAARKTLSRAAAAAAEEARTAEQDRTTGLTVRAACAARQRREKAMAAAARAHAEAARQHDRGKAAAQAVRAAALKDIWAELPNRIGMPGPPLEDEMPAEHAEKPATVDTNFRTELTT